MKDLVVRKGSSSEQKSMLAKIDQDIAEWISKEGINFSQTTNRIFRELKNQSKAR